MACPKVPKKENRKVSWTESRKIELTMQIQTNRIEGGIELMTPIQTNRLVGVGFPTYFLSKSSCLGVFVKM